MEALIVINKNTIGKRINIEITNIDNEPIDVSDSTVYLKLYKIGTTTETWSQEITITDATNGEGYYDLTASDTAYTGMYFTLIYVDYDNGNVETYVGPSIEFIDENEQENLVSVKEFLDFIGIPLENSKPDNVINQYLDLAEAIINSEIPTLANTTNSSKIKIKKQLIKLGAGKQYFLNMDEGNVNPNLRIQKIELWEKQYLAMKNRFMDIVSTNPEGGSAIFRRVKDSSYDDDDDE